ncbi:MAG: phosphoribosylformylglycinamidine synthase I [Elusimicrobia bacterium]|nr:phosphoribosylformylglycinamidine synthase I [Elusimicrobiota bacterium]
MKKRAVVLKAPGTNNDRETVDAIEKSGAKAELVHINEFVRQEKKLNDYDIAVIPGGFSYGDNLGAGKFFSLFLKYKFRDEAIKFIEKGRILLGVCNGFQVLAKAGILPEISAVQKITLASNSNDRFVCRWVRLKVCPACPGEKPAERKVFWFEGFPETIELPVAHAEGRFLAPLAVIREMKSRGQIALEYVDNPNGSQSSVAAVLNEKGNVLGMMPHPERFFYPFQHPACQWKKVFPWGRKFFKNIVKYA